MDLCIDVHFCYSWHGHLTTSLCGKVNRLGNTNYATMKQIHDIPVLRYHKRSICPIYRDLSFFTMRGAFVCVVVSGDLCKFARE